MCSLSAGESSASSPSRGPLPIRFYLVAATTAEWHDLDVLQSRLPSDGSVRIVNRSDAIGTLVVAGPRSRELMGHVTAADLSNAAFPWLAARTIDVLGNPTLVLRVNYVGELGWELHAPMEQLPGNLRCSFRGRAELWPAGFWPLRHGFPAARQRLSRLEDGYRDRLLTV